MKRFALATALILTTSAFADCVSNLNSQIKDIDEELQTRIQDQNPVINTIDNYDSLRFFVAYGSVSSAFVVGHKFAAMGVSGSTAGAGGVFGTIVGLASTGYVLNYLADQEIPELRSLKKQANTSLELIRQAQAGDGEYLNYGVNYIMDKGNTNVSINNLSETIKRLSDKEEICSIDSFDNINMILDKASKEI